MSDKKKRQDILLKEDEEERPGETLFVKRKYSEWVCYVFTNGDKDHYFCRWRALEGREPNWFWRKMQYLLLGNIWVKEKRSE